jgi:ferredoxin
VDEFIRTAIFPGSNKAYFILTCGADTLNAINYVETLCRNKGWELQGFAEIVMPDNYIAVYPAPDKITARETIQKADSSIRQVAEYINDGSEFSIYTAGGFGGRIKSGIVNGLFYKLFVCAKGFYVTEKCTGCGKCSELCSLNNIKVSNIPKWGARCTCCMACIGGCPEAAIEYKNKTQGKKRYYFDLAE